MLARRGLRDTLRDSRLDEALHRVKHGAHQTDSAGLGISFAFVQRLLEQLRDQEDFLASSVARYDAGKEHEAKRLSVSIRLLVHDTRHSRSLLSQLGVKDTLGYLDTALGEAPAGCPPLIHSGLCTMSWTLGAEGDGPAPVSAEPVLDTRAELGNPPTSFVDWWEEPVFVAADGTELTRRFFVLSVADGDGGAHVDDEARLSADYSALVVRNALGFTKGDGEGLDNSVIYASIRQVAHELVRSMEGIIEDPDVPSGARVLEPICRLSIRSGLDPGRNESCPCGSGRKAKRCYLQRRPRRRLPHPHANSG